MLLGPSVVPIRLSVKEPQKAPRRKVPVAPSTGPEAARGWGSGFHLWRRR